MPQINDEYQKLDRSPAALRRFGFTIGTVLLLLGVLFLWRPRAAGWPLSTSGGLILLVALAWPAALKTLHRAWMTVALALGWVMTSVILTVVFFLVVTPLGFLQRVFARPALELSFKKDAPSYWKKRDPRPLDAAEYERQF